MGMWWEMMPVIGIMYAINCIPSIGQFANHKLFYGTMYGRHLTESHKWWLFQRDRSHSAPSPWLFAKRYNRGTGIGDGSPYKTHGLEAYKD